MSPSETYQLLILRNPTGFAMGDVSYVADKGRRKPIVFKKVGECIDLERIDLVQFVRSVRVGDISNMVKGGALKAVAVNVSEQRSEDLHNAFANFDATAPRRSPAASPGHIVLLEPGLQVAVGSGPMGNAPMTPTGTNQVEAGLHVGVSGGDAVEVVVAHGEEVPLAPASLEAAMVGEQDTPETLGAGTEVVAEAVLPEVASWKEGKNLKQQEEYIKASADIEFLQAFIDDVAEESERLKNVAKKRVVALKASAAADPK